MTTKKKKSFSKLPALKCPKCLGDAYVYKLNAICSDERCLAKFSFSPDKINNLDGFIEIEQNNLLLDQSDIDTISQTKSNVEFGSVDFNINGELFSTLKSLGDKYNLGSVADTAAILLISAIDFSFAVDSSKKKQVVLVETDNENNKMRNLKNGGMFFKPKEILERIKQNQNDADQLIEEADRRKLVYDISRVYESLKKDYGDASRE